MTSIQLKDHLLQDRYGEFQLTEAVRPALSKQVIPSQGYRIENYRDKENHLNVPVLAAAVSKENLFEVFLELLPILGEMVDIVVETSHDGDGNHHRDLYRDNIDLPVLQSHLCEFEDLLLNDGCTGVAILSTQQPMEIQFDEHKLLIMYAAELDPFEQVMQWYGIERNDKLKLITEGEHLHKTTPELMAQFEQMCYRIGAGEMAEHANWW